MLSMDDFQPITLDDKKTFDKHFEKYPPVHSDNVFTTLISWVNYSKYQYAIINDNLVICSNIKNKFQIRPPSGKKDKNFFDEVLKLAKKEGSEFPVAVLGIHRCNPIIAKNSRITFTYFFIFLAVLSKENPISKDVSAVHAL